MKIVKYKKRSNGLYTLYLDDCNTYDMYEEIILKYELLLKKNISNDELLKIQSDNKNYESYYEALKTLKKSLKTKKEIEEKLEKKEYNKTNIEFALKILEKQGYINDKSYAKSYVHNAIIISLKGPNKIILELENKGIAPDDYIDALKEYTNEIEIEKINKIVTKKINSNHNKSAKVLKQKISLDLINNGFTKELIKEVISNLKIEENKSIKEKEYQKYYNKLSKKYNGKELEFKLKQKMYSLGFSVDNE